MSKIKFGSVCSGIEAASVAWEPLGWEASWVSEIEPFPAALLSHRFPKVENLGDMREIPNLIRAWMAEAPDILVGGTPCQAFSVAGMRGGLADERGSLTMTFVEIANEIDREKKCVVVWENAPGVLSSKDNAFGCFLGALAGEDCELQPAGKRWPNAGCVLGPKRAIAWRVLDAQHFGLAQRRKRVFLVASARSGFDPAKVLFEFGSVRRDSPPSRSAGESAAGFAAGGAGATGFRKLTFESYTQDETASTMMARDYKSYTDLVVPINTMTMLGRPSDDKNPRMGLGIGEPHHPQNTLTKAHSHAVFNSGEGVVRRLTPTECERLQGFPDGWTMVPWRGKPAQECPDGHRYKALGNSMAVPVMRWIGERIEQQLREET